jgi:hypothetical protein
MSKQIQFFQTRNDLEVLDNVISSFRHIKYVKAGLFDDSYPRIYDSIFDFEELGINKTGQVMNTSNMFLVFDKLSEIKVRPVLQKSGEVKYAIDQMKNLDSIFFRPNGVYDETNLVAGNLGTISTHPTSIELYNLFRKTIQKHSQKIGNYYVAENALKLMKLGVRMITIGIDSPREYDLKF